MHNGGSVWIFLECGNSMNTRILKTLRTALICKRSYALMRLIVVCLSFSRRVVEIPALRVIKVVTSPAPSASFKITIAPTLHVPLNRKQLTFQRLLLIYKD